METKKIEGKAEKKKKGHRGGCTGRKKRHGVMKRPGQQNVTRQEMADLGPFCWKNWKETFLVWGGWGYTRMGEASF